MRLLFIALIFICVSGQIQFDDANMVAFSHSGGGWTSFLSQWLIHWFRFQHQKADTSFADYVSNKVIGSNSGGSWFSTYLTHSPMLRDSLSLDRKAFIDKVAQMYSTQGEKLKAKYEDLHEGYPKWLNTLCVAAKNIDSFKMFCSDEGMAGIYTVFKMESWEQYLELSLVELNEDGNEIDFNTLIPLPELKNVDWTATNTILVDSLYKEEVHSNLFKKTIKYTGYALEKRMKHNIYPTFTSFKFDGSNMPERQVEIPLLENKDKVEFVSWEITCNPRKYVSDVIVNDLFGKCDDRKWLHHNSVVKVNEIKKAIISATSTPNMYAAGSSAALGMMASTRHVKKSIFDRKQSSYDISTAIGLYAATTKVEHEEQNLPSDDLSSKKFGKKFDLFENLALALWKYALPVDLPNGLGFAIADGGLYDDGLIGAVRKLQQNNVTEGEIVQISAVSADKSTDILWAGSGDEKAIFKGTKDKSRVVTYPGKKASVTYHEQCVETVENLDNGVKAGYKYKINAFTVQYHPDLAMIVISGTVDKYYVPAMKEVLDLLETIPYDKVSNTCSWQSTCTV